MMESRRSRWALGLTLVASCAAAPPPPSPAPPAGIALRQAAIVLHRWEGSARAGEVVLIDPGGLLVGAAGAPLARKLFAERQRVHELAGFTRRWRPFTVRTLEGELQFRGGGALAAGAVERRMVREWTRMVAAEAEPGTRSGVYGLALVWQRGDPQAGSGAACDELRVWLAGTARAGDCAGAPPRRPRGRADAVVDAARMATLYRWIDELAPLQLAAAGETREGAPPRLVLAAAGRRSAGAAERRAIASFAATLHAELRTSPSS